MTQAVPQTQDFTTITLVVRNSPQLAEDLASLISPDEVMFFTVEDGVSDLALNMGADPEGWQ